MARQICWVSRVSADIIEADTGRQLAQAWSQMRGALRDPVTRWRQAIIKIAAELEAVIDFPDEEIPASVVASIGEGVDALIAEISACLDDNRIGERVRDGVQVTLLGSRQCWQINIVESDCQPACGHCFG